MKEFWKSANIWRRHWQV